MNLRQILAISLLTTAEEQEQQNNAELRQQRQRCWTKKWIRKYRNRGPFETIYQEWRISDPELYRSSLRLSPENFDWLLEKIRPFIEKQNTRLRQSIPADKRLAITLKYLATGESFVSLSRQFVVGECTVTRIIRETCRAIIRTLKGFLEVPSSEADWKKVADNFLNKWNYPNAIGALDGKHIVVQKPDHSGSNYYNYKHTFSVVLMALVDADGCFLYVDVGSNGKISDATIWERCKLKECILNGTLNLPPPAALPSTNVPVPYHILGDDIFPLTTYLMKPYPRQRDIVDLPRRIADFRMSRARRIVENAFGILVHRFEIFRSPIRMQVEEVKFIVLACVFLHNWLTKSRCPAYLPAGYSDSENLNELVNGGWRSDGQSDAVQNMGHQGSNNSSMDAREMRNHLKDYFNGPGALDWQTDVVLRHHREQTSS